VLITLLLTSCLGKQAQISNQPEPTQEPVQKSELYDFSRPPWIMNLVSITTYEGRAGNTQYAYHVVGKLQSSYPIKYDRVEAHFDSLKIEQSYSETQEMGDAFTFDTDGHTNDLLRDAQDRSIVLFVTYYFENEAVITFFTVLPALDEIPAGGTPLEFEVLPDQEEQKRT
jgi:hypothetical protein